RADVEGLERALLSARAHEHDARPGQSCRCDAARRWRAAVGQRSRGDRDERQHDEWQKAFHDTNTPLAPRKVPDLSMPGPRMDLVPDDTRIVSAPSWAPA